MGAAAPFVLMGRERDALPRVESEGARIILAIPLAFAVAHGDNGLASGLPPVRTKGHVMASSRPRLSQSAPTTPSASGKKAQAPPARRLNQFDPQTQAAAAQSVQTATAQAEAVKAETYRKSGITSAMLQLQGQMSDLYVSAQAASANASALVAEPGQAGAENINGSYLGLIEKRGRRTGEIGLVMTVRAKQDEDAVAPQFLFPPSELVGGERVRIDVRGVGPIIAQQGFQSRETPARYGASIGFLEHGTGTLGCLVATSGNDLCILSNNHVLADAVGAPTLSPIVQPGDFEHTASGVIGFLTRIQSLNLVTAGDSAPNRVDCALALTTFKDCIPRLHGDIPFVGSPTGAFPRMPVIKQGRTTGHTEGQVIGLNGNPRVGYEPRNSPPMFGDFFQTDGQGRRVGEQIVLEGFNGPLSLKGDSGSLILGFVDGEFHPIGLLFAGTLDGAITWANPIDLVMQALGIAEILDPGFPIEE